MSFLSLVGVEFKKIKRSKIFLILFAATVILWIPSILNADMNFNMQAEGISPENNFFIQGFMGMAWFMFPASMVVGTVLLSQTERTNKGMYKEPQALMSCRGAYSGTMNKSLPYSYVTSNSLIISSPRGLMGTDCIYYLFSALNVSELISGTAQPQVTVQAFDGFPIPLSPLAEQQRIVDRIESLFAKLDEAKEKAQAVVDSFETRKAAILHKAFTGELTAKWREEHGVGMDSWEHHQFSDLCAIVRGGSPRPAGDPRYYDGNIPFMKVADITRNDSPYVSKVEYSIKEEGLKKTRMVEANTLLLTNSGATLGVPAITTIRTTFNDGIAAFIGLDIDSLLFYYYFWTSKTAFLRSINMGAAQPNLNTKLIGEVEIDVPQTAERVEIARVLNALLSKEQQAKEAAEAVLDQIDLMKKSILARAFRGELGTNDPSEESAVELLKQLN